ncbi:acyl-CoA dehydrogenase family protein [Lacisediminimonas sp.]|uniref:acyl-CoA dehydrogenase family protein n=1 Tax=Lacisediminimonas sp. TaxID=3060582 RepID=UPI0027172D20|nr:acyl-CoA dehydrogenase family protein [Lacisediminimonas sp.]MDO8301318.1 acyl-CoA dehydrogenase family protein [Lacisediminimonas sp.]
MDFNFSDEQKQFADALQRWVAKDYGFEQRKQIIHSPAGVSAQAWSTLAELGMTALPIPEQQGGFNGTAVDMLVVMQEIGRALVVEPYLATMMGARFLQLAGAQEVLLERVATGELVLACALLEKQSRYDLADVETRATAAADGFVLNGAKCVVVHGGQAGMLIVSARSSGDTHTQDGISLFVVAADAPGLTVRDYRTIDGQRAADMVFANVQVPASALLGQVGRGWDTLDAGADYGAALLCAEAVGAMEALNAATLEYLKTRQQFGVPIGKFQALQHKMADMFIQQEQARSMATLAAVRVDGADVEQRRRSVSAAKVRIGQALKYVGQQAIQLHGGMGVTDELPASHYFKRLSMIELTLGDTDYHLMRFASQPGFRKLA